MAHLPQALPAVTAPASARDKLLSRVAGGDPAGSPFVKMTRGEKIVVRLSRKLAYEADGGVRPPARRLKVRAKARTITVRAPR